MFHKHKYVVVSEQFNEGMDSKGLEVEGIRMDQLREILYGITVVTRKCACGVQAYERVVGKTAGSVS